MAPRGVIFLLAWPTHLMGWRPHPSRRAQGRAPQDDVLPDPHGEERWQSRASRTMRSRSRNLLSPQAEDVLIPRRRKTGIYAALVFRQRRDRLDVLVVEPDIERVEIGLLALGPRRLRNRGDAVLVEQPFQRHLR